LQRKKRESMSLARGEFEKKRESSGTEKRSIHPPIRSKGKKNFLASTQKGRVKEGSS